MRADIKEKLQVWGPRVALPIAYVFCLALFFLVTFPYERLKDRIVVAFNQQQRQTNGSQELAIDELGSYWFTGVKAKGVHLLTANNCATKVPPPAPGTCDASKPPTDMVLEVAHARVQVLPLLIGNHDVNFGIDGFGGKASGSFDDHGSARIVEVTVDEIDLALVQALNDAVGLPLEGHLSGTVKLDMPEGKASKGTGTVDMTGSDIAIGDGKSKLKGVPMAAIPLPRLLIGTLTFQAEATEGSLKLTKLEATGKDLELQGEGRIVMRELATDSIADIYIRFKVNDGYRGKSDITKSLFGDPGGKIPAAIDLDPKVKQSKRADGFYGWHLHGPLGRLAFDASAYGGVTGNASRPPAAAPSGAAP